ncbi:type IV pilus modification PilV family protein [Aquibacillus kalidii]|uniref:type IV pilus modification PilV family protein n=1 Tax=Aquibacillus kalidii TaxID=2762597 RepID=UPI00164932D4|nr:type II secretion system protein [Aquibacillus kalidii]
MGTLLKSNKGFTLIEILASITILSIVILSFLAFFVQSAKTNEITEDISDATYLAQEEMEKMYHITTQYTFSKALTELVENTGYVAGQNNGATMEYTFSKDTDEYKIALTLDKPSSTNIGNVLVKVYESKSNKLEAQMETIYNWKKLEGESD